MKSPERALASSGHFLGQVVGDWWEKYVIKPQLDVIAKDLGLFADSRFAKRSCRGDKIHWNDTAGNAVDYDFVLELDGNLEKIGTPVAFLESFWRRGARHSKDKARDDTNKLLPMSETYPTARFLAIAACGEFTQPARDYVKSRGIHLFFIPKKSIIQAFKTVGVEIDYDDSATEIDKNRIADKARGILEERTYDLAAKNLIDIVGQGSFKAFSHQIVSSLGAQPQEIRITQAAMSDPAVFKSVDEASDFLSNPKFQNSDSTFSYIYDVTYSDGTEFHRRMSDIDGLKALHHQLYLIVDHMNRV